MALPPLLLSVAALAVLAPATSRAADDGVITGQVTIEGPPPACAPLKVNKDEAVCGKEKPNESILVGKSGAMRNVVVTLKDAKAPDKVAPVTGAAVDQKGCQYAPHVLAVTVGTELAVMNNDAVLHNIHARVGNIDVFNVAMPIKGQRIPNKLKKAGIIKLQCDAGHTWMSAYVHVLPHPWFAVTDDTGAFSIKNVPAGEHTLELWHEPVDGKGAPVTKTIKVTVPPGGTARADASMKLSV